MIIKSNPIATNSKPADIFNYCMFADKNEHIDVINGDMQDVADCFDDAEIWNRKNSLLHVQASSKEPLTKQQFMNLQNRIVDELNIPVSYVVCSTIHTFKNPSSTRDPQHLHIVVRMINPETGKPIDLSNKYQRQEKISRMFEVDNGLALVKGRHNRAVYENVPYEYKEALKHLTEGPLPNSFLRDGQYQMQSRSGMNSFEIRAKCKELLSQCENLQSFSNAIQAHGWTIKQGSKKLILNDEKGNLVGSVDRIFGMKKSEFESFKGDFEPSPNQGSQPYSTSDIKEFCSAKYPCPDTNKLAKAVPVEPFENTVKPVESQNSLDQGNKPSELKGHMSGPADEVQTERIDITDDMTQGQKIAIITYNKMQSEKDNQLRQELEHQKAMSKIYEGWKNPKPSIWANWTNHINREIERHSHIIDMQHPTLKPLDEKNISNWISKNFKSELQEFKNGKSDLIQMAKDIKALDAKGGLFKFMHQRKADKFRIEQKEKSKSISMMAIMLSHNILFGLKMTSSPANTSDYKTMEQIKEAKRGSYYQKFMMVNGSQKAIDAIALAKKWERDAKIQQFMERPEAIEAGEKLRKLNRVKSLSVARMNDDEKDDLNELVASLDVDAVNNLLTSVNSRISREEQEADAKTNVIDFSHEQKKKDIRKKKKPSFDM